MRPQADCSCCDATTASWRLITTVPDGARWHCIHDEQELWAQATAALQAALLQKAQHAADRLTGMQQAGRMAQTALGTQQEMLRIIEERVIESRERFNGPWANIPVHDHTHMPRLIQRLEQPLSTYEGAVAAINGDAAVVERRLREDAPSNGPTTFTGP